MAKAKRISLTQGKSALVDAADFERLNVHNWTALKVGKTFYAVRKAPDGGLIYMHREVLHTPRLVDHKDEVGTDNRKENLVPTDQRGNQTGVKHVSKSATKTKAPTKGKAKGGK